jgi:hypothetical protein
MFARVQSGQIEPHEAEAFSRMVRDDVIPGARDLQGFQGDSWLAERSTGHVLGVLLCEIQAALRESTPGRWRNALDCIKLSRESRPATWELW